MRRLHPGHPVRISEKLERHKSIQPKILKLGLIALRSCSLLEPLFVCCHVFSIVQFVVGDLLALSSKESSAKSAMESAKSTYMVPGCASKII